MKKRIFFGFLLLIISLSVYAQQNSRVAVLPFTAIDTSENEARVVTSLFETALVKTGVYNVIEQNQIDEILDAQAYSLSGCTDDSCAIEIGELLSAEIIVIGEFSKVGSGYITNVKMIDVSVGKNINADSVTADNISEMTENAIILLAYKLAGLTYKGSNEEIIADAFGEIYVSTSPDGAEIYIDGIMKGLSPLVIKKVPVGDVKITVSKDNLLGEQVISLSDSDLIEVQIELKQSIGRLFIKSSDKNVDVHINGENLGSIESGIFKDIISGEHELLLKGKELMWCGNVIVEADKTTTVDAWLSPYGTVEYNLPEGSICEMSGSEFNKILAEEGEIDLKVGSYNCFLTGENYIRYEQIIFIEKGKTIILEPELGYTEEYQEYLTEKEKEETRDSLESKMHYLEMKLNAIDTSEEESLSELMEARILFESVKNCGHDLPETESEARELFAESISLRIDVLDALSSKAKAAKEAIELGQWISFGAGTVGFLVSGIFKLIGDSEYETYQSAASSSESAESHEKLSLYSVLQTGGLVAGSIGAIGGGSLFFIQPDPEQYTTEIASLSVELAKLKGGLI